MPYKNNDELPKAIKGLPKAAQSLFRKAFNAAYARDNTEETCFQIAWSVVKKRFKKVDGKWVARLADFEDVQYYTFQATPAEEFISRTKGGNIIHNYVLTDTTPDLKGTAPTEELIKKWASWINENKPEVDIDHELFDKGKEMYGGNVSFIRRLLNAKKGIAKAVKAFVDKGKLIVSLMFDKRYESHIEKIKGLSIEAVAPAGEKFWNTGELLGFTFGIGVDPVNPRAVRVGR